MEVESHIIYIQVPKKKWDTMLGDLEEIKNILTNRTFPKKLTPYSLREFAQEVGVHYKTVLNWIHTDKILSKRGVESYKKNGQDYVIMIDQEELKK